MTLSPTAEAVVSRSVYVFLVLAVTSLAVSIAASSIAMWIGIAAWLVLLAFSPRRIFHPTPLDYFFLAYVLAELCSTVFSVDPVASLVNAKRLFLIAVVYMTVSSIDSRQKIFAAIAVFSAAAAFLSIVEILMLSKVGEDLRLAVFQHYMTAGGMKMIVSLLLLAVAVEKTTPAKWRLWASVAFVPAFAALILTQTRSAWLGFLAGGITMGILNNKWILAGLAALVVIFLLFAPSDFQSRAASIFDPTLGSNVTRIHMIQTGWRMFLDYPVFGTGDIDLRNLYVTYTEPIDAAEGGHLHNNFVMLLVTLGAVGFLAVMALFVKILLVEWNILRETKRHWLYGSVAMGSLAVYVGFHVNGLFEWNFGDHEIAVFLWFTVGLALAARKLAEPRVAQVA